jgi:hypothetical protein
MPVEEGIGAAAEGGDGVVKTDKQCHDCTGEVLKYTQELVTERDGLKWQLEHYRRLVVSLEWKQIACPNCGGHGIVSHYSYGPDGVDFDGADECKRCSGSGELWLSPKGRIAQYPGGPFVGRVTSAYFAHYNSAGEA